MHHVIQRSLLWSSLLALAVATGTGCRIEPSEGEGEGDAGEGEGDAGEGEGDAGEGEGDAGEGEGDAGEGEGDVVGEGEGEPAGTIVVFDDDFRGVAYAPFGGSTGAPVVDTTEHNTGTASMRIDVPAAGFVGGALVSGADAVDLSGVTAISFNAKVSAGTHTLNVVGMGNDANGGLDFAIERANIPLTTTFTRVVLPLPSNADTAEHGLFHLAEGSDEGAYSIFIDDLQYESAPVSVVSAAIATVSVDKAIGETASVAGRVVTLNADGGDINLTTVGPRWFDYSSDDEAVATVDALGVVTALTQGTAVITANVGATLAGGTLTFNVTGAASTPPDAAPTPSFPAGEVLAIYSSTYSNEPVNTLLAGFSAAALEDFTIPGTSTVVKKYTLNNFAGIEFLQGNSLNLNTDGLDTFSMTVWTPDVDSLLIKVVDFDAANAFVAEVPQENPIATKNAWVTIDVPLPLNGSNGAFIGDFVSQIILDGHNNTGGNTVFVDHMIFHK